MMSDLSAMEKRLSTLERDVAQIKQRLHRTGDAAEWLDGIAGSMKEQPDFDEFVRLGQKFRESQTDPE